MSKAYLTVDDVPTANTPKIIDYLSEKNITPIMFSVGNQLEKYFDEAVYALKKGAIIGNHSYTHPGFSKLSFDECIGEIEKQEDLLNKLYAYAGVERKYKLFRFPYGDKGGENKVRLQEYLKQHFRRIDDRDISFGWYHENSLDTDTDVFWTFDFCEYRLADKDGFTFETILERIHTKTPDSGGVLLDETANHIILIHDIEVTEAIMPNYFKTLIDYVTDHGVEFIKPRFLPFNSETSSV